MNKSGFPGKPFPKELVHTGGLGRKWGTTVHIAGPVREALSFALGQLRKPPSKPARSRKHHASIH